MQTSDHQSLIRQAEALLEGHTDWVANAANIAALIWMNLADINWAGFYFLKGNELILGPFQGKPACVSIPMGQGVCGTAAQSRENQRVEDVHEFEGHIACDVDSRSELVVPLIRSGQVIGVLDLDSPIRNRFTAGDEALMTELAEIYVKSLA